MDLGHGGLYCAGPAGIFFYFYPGFGPSLLAPADARLRPDGRGENLLPLPAQPSDGAQNVRTSLVEARMHRLEGRRARFRKERPSLMRTMPRRFGMRPVFVLAVACLVLATSGVFCCLSGRRCLRKLVLMALSV